MSTLRRQLVKKKEVENVFTLTIHQNKTYYDNEKISGLLICQTTVEEEYSYVIAFIACRVKHWKNGVSTFRDIIFQEPQTLATNYFMNVGTHQFEYSLTLPENMPPTCHDRKNLSVEWFVLAKTLRANYDSESGFTRQIAAKQYFRKGSLYVPHPELAPKCEKDRKTAFGKGSLLAQASLSKDVFFRGETIEVDLTINNEAKGLEVTAINLTIEQQFRSHHKKKNSNGYVTLESVSVLDQVKSIKQCPIKSGSHVTDRISTTPRFLPNENCSAVIVPSDLVDAMSTEFDNALLSDLRSTNNLGSHSGIFTHSAGNLGQVGPAPSTLNSRSTELPSATLTDSSRSTSTGSPEQSSPPSQPIQEPPSIVTIPSSDTVEFNNNNNNSNNSNNNNNNNNARPNTNAFNYVPIPRHIRSGNLETASNDNLNSGSITDSNPPRQRRNSEQVMSIGQRGASEQMSMFPSQQRRRTSKFREIMQLQQMIGTDDKNNKRTHVPIALVPSFNIEDENKSLNLSISYVVKMKIKLRGASSIKFEMPFILSDEAEHGELEEVNTSELNTVYVSSKPNLVPPPPTYSLLHIQSLDCLDMHHKEITNKLSNGLPSYQDLNLI